MSVATNTARGCAHATRPDFFPTYGFARSALTGKQIQYFLVHLVCPTCSAELGLLIAPIPGGHYIHAEGCA